MRPITEAQLQMLRDLDDGGPTDYADFHDRAGAALGWRNRERVLEALSRKELIDDDLKLTEEGRAVLASHKAVQP